MKLGRLAGAALQRLYREAREFGFWLLCWLVLVPVLAGEAWRQWRAGGRDE